MARGITDNIQAIMGFYAGDAMRAMLNRPLASIKLSSDKSRITFEFEDGGAQSFGVEGDCCSSSWIEELTVPDDVVGSAIIDVKEALMDEVENGEYGECVKSYQTVFVTPKGEIVLEYRNSSNGYYGGYLVAV